MRERAAFQVIPSKTLRNPQRITRRRRLVSPAPHDVTQLLRAWSDGDKTALDQAGAARRVRVAPARPRVHGPRAERPHPAGDSARQRGVLRFTDARQVRWQDPAHFLGIAARLIRRILVNHARARGYHKRGGGVERVILEDARLVAAEPPLDVVELDRTGSLHSGGRAKEPGRGAAFLRGADRRRDSRKCSTYPQNRQARLVFWPSSGCSGS